MSKTLQIVRLVATEFENLSDETIEMWIDLTAPLISKKVFGKLYEQALASGAADGDQGACISVQRATDDGHLPLAHVGGDFFRGVVAG